jgi:hypothetical protein
MHGFLLLSFKELWFLKSGPVLFSVDINITIVFQLALRFWQSIIFLRTCSFFFSMFQGRHQLYIWRKWNPYGNDHNFVFVFFTFMNFDILLWNSPLGLVTEGVNLRKPNFLFESSSISPGQFVFFCFFIFLFEPYFMVALYMHLWICVWLHCACIFESVLLGFRELWLQTKYSVAEKSSSMGMTC